MNRSKPRVALALLAVAVTLTAVAVAFAAPKKGMWLTKLKSASSYGEGSGAFRVADGPSIKRARQLLYILVPSDFKCGSPVIKKSKIPIRGGKFVFDGPGYLRTEAKEYKGHITWKGSFPTKTKVKGTIRWQSPVTPTRGNYKQKPCDTGTQNFVGKFSP